MKITWFRHHHENRNDLLRFGFMRLHYAGELQYVELPFADARQAGFGKAIMDYPDHRHLSFILVESGTNKIRCMVDNEDSFALISPLVREVDFCFCAGYNADFFEKKQFVQPYCWQDENDLKGYRELLEQKIQRFGDQFHKIKRFIPIGPNQGTPSPSSGWKQKIKNVGHRLSRVMGKGSDFSVVYQSFESREAYMNSLRNEELKYDIVLNDSLWGWPRHRLNLHTRLKELSGKKYQIHSILNWNAPVAIDGSVNSGLGEGMFPLKTNPFYQSYELMLAQSKLAVFACGFHWGWRNIMMFALKVGVPVLTDRLLTEPYFDINEFKIFQQDDHQWESVEKVLNSFDASEWLRYKEHNQKTYDRYMSPEAVANYFISSLYPTRLHENKFSQPARTSSA